MDFKPNIQHLHWTFSPSWPVWQKGKCLESPQGLPGLSDSARIGRFVEGGGGWRLQSISSHAGDWKHWEKIFPLSWTKDTRLILQSRCSNHHAGRYLQYFYCTYEFNRPRRWSNLSGTGFLTVICRLLKSMAACLSKVTLSASDNFAF